MTVGNDGTVTPFRATLTLPDEPATVNLGRALGDVVKGGDVILLSGDLGAGKTALARGLIQHLAGSDTEVPSPTFTLVQTYDAGFGPIHHFDLYRIEHPGELLEVGLEDALGDGLCLIEWPDRMAGWHPANSLTESLNVEILNRDEGREAVISAEAGGWRGRLVSRLMWDTLSTASSKPAG